MVPDSKFLGDPVDLLVFNGLSNGRVDSLSFVEVKTGKARLNAHQKSIKAAIEDQKVGFKVFE
jgi:predicted Holliday junction resolvase-like endonuclease